VGIAKNQQFSLWPKSTLKRELHAMKTPEIRVCSPAFRLLFGRKKAIMRIADFGRQFVAFRMAIDYHAPLYT
jgi:hypothetical protein